MYVAFNLRLVKDVVVDFQTSIVKPSWYFDVLVEKVQFIDRKVSLDISRTSDGYYQLAKSEKGVVRQVCEELDTYVNNFQQLAGSGGRNKEAMRVVGEDLAKRWNEYREKVDLFLKADKMSSTKFIAMMELMRPSFFKMSDITQAYRGKLMRSDYNVGSDFNKIASQVTYIALAVGATTVLVMVLIVVLLVRVYKQNVSLGDFRTKLKREIRLIKGIREKLLISDKEHSIGKLKASIMSKEYFEMSADYWDIFPVKGNKKKIGVIIADVAGHGVTASLVALLLKFFVDAYQNEMSEGEGALSLVKKINEGFSNIFTGTGFYFTMVYSELDLDSMEIESVSGGHPVPIIVRERTGKVELLFEEKNVSPIVGVSEHASYTSVKRHIEMGDVLFYYTDGLKESRNKAGEFYGDEGIFKFFEQSNNLPFNDMMRMLFVDIEKFEQNEVATDDKTAILLKCG